MPAYVYQSRFMSVYLYVKYRVISVILILLNFIRPYVNRVYFLIFVTEVLNGI